MQNIIIEIIRYALMNVLTVLYVPAYIVAIAAIAGLIFLYSVQQAYALDIFGGLFGSSEPSRQQEIYTLVSDMLPDKASPYAINSITEELYKAEQLSGERLSEFGLQLEAMDMWLKGEYGGR